MYIDGYVYIYKLIISSFKVYPIILSGTGCITEIIHYVD